MHKLAVHGGSMRVFLRRVAGKRQSAPIVQQMIDEELRAGALEAATYDAFAARVATIKRDLLAMLRDLKAQGLRIAGYGAPAKGNTLLNYFAIGTELIECLVEKNEMRRGLFSPGMHIPVVIEKELAQPPDIYYVLAWNFKTEILARNRQLVEHGVEFFFPVEPKGA